MKSHYQAACVAALALAFVLVAAFCPRGVVRPLSASTSTCLLATGSSSLHYSSDNEDDENDSATPFDMDFADAMSKPLPDWFLEEKREKEEMMKGILENRERISAEFRAKYEVSEEEKEKDRREKEAKLQARKMALKSKRKGKAGFFQKALGVSTADTDEVEEDETTRNKWEKFWEEEEQTTGFSLPGFFEVFPELKLMWPTWAKRRDGSAIECEVDADCAFPQACCPHPIIPGDKFCCTGWTQRIMVPAYQRQLIQSDGPLQGNNNNGDDGMAPPETGGYGLPEN